LRADSPERSIFPLGQRRTGIPSALFNPFCRLMFRLRPAPLRPAANAGLRDIRGWSA